MKRTILTLIAAALLAGCASVGHHIEKADVDRIKPGQTTLEQMKTMFGKPTEVGTDGTQMRAQWNRVEAKAVVGVTRHDRLWAVFNENGTVDKFDFVQQ